MDCWAFSKHKSWLYWSLMLMVIQILMFGQTQGDCIEEERNALLEIKASHINSFDSIILPTWVDYDTSTPGNGGGNCCDWERVTCNTTSGHVTELSLSNLRQLDYDYREDRSKLWPLNVSLFLHFKELRSLKLSFNFLEKESMKTGLKRLSSLKKLEVLDLNRNLDIDNDILPSLKTLTSLKILDLSKTNLNGNFPTNEFAALDNLEMLDLSSCGFDGTFEIQGFERVSILRKLKTLNLGSNGFNESVITSLSTLPSLTNLDLSGNNFMGVQFPPQELSYLTNLEELNLAALFSGTSNIQACKSLSRLKRLVRIDLSKNLFNKSVVSCLSALPSLKILDLSFSLWGSSFPIQGISFPIQEFLNLFDVEVLLLRDNGFTGTLPMEAFTSLHHLRVLDLSENNFVGSIPSTIHALSSLQALSLSTNELDGSLSDQGLCELKNLLELDLSYNMLNGTLPQCMNKLSSLKQLDISYNQFTGILVPSLIANLTSLEYIDFSHNSFEGKFSFSSFYNHRNLEAVLFRSDNDKFEVETEEPTGWIPIFQLKVLVLSNSNMNRHKGRVVPGFLLHQHKLRVLDLSYNSLEGQLPNWLIKNNKDLEILNLRNNSLIGNMHLLHWNANMKRLDMSGNQITGNIPDNIPKVFPNINYLNLSRNILSGAIPSSIGDLSRLEVLDLSYNELLGEVPLGLFTNTSGLWVLNLSKNKLFGDVLSGNLSFTNINLVYLDSNHFTGTIGINNSELKFGHLHTLDISNNFFTGMIPDWIGNMTELSELVVRNNSFEGRFPCGAASFSFLDISQNYFYGPIPSCLNLQNMKHLHLGSNRFIGSVPNSFRNLTNVLTLDMGDNNLSGRVPGFIGQLSDLRILLLRNNNFNGSIPKQLCRLRNASLIDLSKNSLSGSIPRCLQNIIGPTDLAFLQIVYGEKEMSSTYRYGSALTMWVATDYNIETFETRDEVQFTTKSMSLRYQGDMLDLMAGMDLSCNKLTGEIPEELGLLAQIRALNLSHNHLTGPIPVNFSNLANIESLDLSSNGLTGKVSSDLSKLTFLSTFNVSHNNLSGRLPEMKAQFGTFAKESYEGNPFLCGPPLEKKCTTEPHVTDPSLEEGTGTEKWYDVDMTCFYGSSSSTMIVFMLGFVALLYIRPYLRKRWLDLVEECMYKCYYFLYDSVRKPFMIFHKVGSV